MTDWPWPEDSREDRAKRVARSYRELVVEIARGRCFDLAGALHRLDERWARHEVHWLTPRPDLLTEADEWMSAPDLAHALSKPRKDIYNWARRGHIEQRVGPDGAPQYLVGSVVSYQAKLVARRMGISDTEATA